MKKGSKRVLAARKSVVKARAARVKYNHSFNRGYNCGYDRGHDQAYQSGWEAGISSFLQPFHGTSIIIVTTNDQRAHLQNCIESIYEHTPEPFEIIIIDNASTDDTEAYLKTLTGKVRYRVYKSNLGFAGGTNQGLRLARGTTLLFLNNDTIVTKNWLKNMLTCLYSNEKYGLVGPVTNYISGEQLIETNYSSTEEMHRFAAVYNQSDSSKWYRTGRLTGFCVLMRRDVFDRLGYLDEGFEIGNCEDDDYGLRTRLMGLDLIIVKDTFIHHVGSVSIKALGERLEEVYGKNLNFYSRKWSDSHSLLQEVQQKLEGTTAAMNHFYPTHMVVRGVTSQLYWIENEFRHPIMDSVELSSSRISQLDLRNWRMGMPVNGQEVLNKLTELASESWNAVQLKDGMLVKNGDYVFQVRGNKIHRIINEWALSYWNLTQRQPKPISQETLQRYTQGLPILAPAVIVANNV
ncbi:Glycosyltransferase, GT2 family [Paenibacillus sp. yr247]|uniref:glycosyltransferase family 2 protein n=1 Tax=Paenibacillus sp. yr247 TaxID=1761880 RepID=UPI00088A5332|nr:glycosyltransferase family 2 protein [Paenibacillus sp. yr247]SDN58961.1 Glycosyltransferase, GT2 family [Paenibacillus sp. yr247]